MFPTSLAYNSSSMSMMCKEFTQIIQEPVSQREEARTRFEGIPRLDAQHPKDVKDSEDPLGSRKAMG